MWIVLARDLTFDLTDELIQICTYVPEINN